MNGDHSRHDLSSFRSITKKEPIVWKPIIMATPDQPLMRSWLKPRASNFRVNREDNFAIAHSVRAKASAHSLAVPFRFASPCAGLEPCLALNGGSRPGF